MPPRREAPAGTGEEVVVAELADLSACEALCEGIDGVVHLGGQSIEADWETVLRANISGCYNLFEAARRKGVKRVVFASSNHAVGFYPRHRRIGTDVTVRPDSRYGVSKAFGEALAALYADKHGLSVLCLRIGNVADAPADRRRLSIWVSPEDLAQLVRIGLEHPDLRYEIFYGASLNERSWWDNARAFAYGGHKGRAIYDPEAPPELHASADAYKRNTGSSVNHFYEKLLLLHDRMNTPTARRLAAGRHAFMEAFLARFFAEWEGRE